MNVVLSEIKNFVLFPLALFTGLGDIKLSEYEQSVVNRRLAAYIWQSTFSLSFLAWRRRLLYFASALLGATSTLQIAAFAYGGGIITTEERDQYTNFGLVGIVSQRMASFVALAATISAGWLWADYTKSRNILLPGWVLSVTLMLLPTLIPLQYVLVESTLLENLFLGARSALAVTPTYLAIMSGLTLGAKRVFGFAPSPLTGTVVVISAAFGIVIPFAAFTLVVQALGNILLLIGIFLLLLGPVLVLSNASKFTAITAFSSGDALIRTKRILLISTCFRLAGLITIGAWAVQYILVGVYFAVEVSGSDTSKTWTIITKQVSEELSISLLVDAIIGFFGGMMFQAVLWTDIVIHVSRNDDVKMRKLQSDLYEE